MAYSQGVSADNPTLGPRIEIGGGMSGFRMRSRPEWATKYYGTGLVTGAVRLYRGLSIRVGKEYGYGKKLYTEWLDYGENLRLKTYKGAYKEVSWLGVRYEIPMSTFHSDFMGINFIGASLGMMYTKYGIRTDTWEKGDTIEENEYKKNFRTASVSGPYTALVARWRLDTDVTQGSESWFGAYGLDIGVRYVRYTDSTTRRDNIMKPNSAFSCFQVFVVGFLKIKLLY